MAFRPLVSVPHIGALALALASFMVTYPIAQFLVRSVSPVFGVLLLAAPLIGSGVVVGYKASRAPLMHGVILGAGIGIFAIVLMAAVTGVLVSVTDIPSILRAGSSAVIYMAVPGIVLCSLGAVIGDHLRGRTSRG